MNTQQQNNSMTSQGNEDTGVTQPLTAAANRIYAMLCCTQAIAMFQAAQSNLKAYIAKWNDAIAAGKPNPEVDDVGLAAHIMCCTNWPSNLALHGMRALGTQEDIDKCQQPLDALQMQINTSLNEMLPTIQSPGVVTKKLITEITPQISMSSAMLTSQRYSITYFEQSLQSLGLGANSESEELVGSGK